MDDVTLSDLMAAAILKSACASARCRVSAEVHKWWIFVVHLDDHAHVCPGCDWRSSYPRHFVSMQTLVGGNRESLVAEVAAFLSHLHQAPAESIGGGSCPVDADPTTGCASFDGGGSTAGADSDPICWDRVASVPGD
jgi:hypothetical protein